MRRAGAEHGFTLVELVVAMSISLVVLGAILFVLETFQTNARFAELRDENQNATRLTLDRLSHQLRNVIARTTSTGTVPGALEQAAKDEVTFETVNTSEASGTENQLHAMRVRYCLNDANPEDEILWEQVRRWETKEGPASPTSEDPSTESTCPDRVGEGTSKPDWNTTKEVVQNITNRVGGRERPLFTYSAKETPQILAVNVDMFLNINPKQTRPGETELTSGVSLRNANRQPIAEFTATEEGDRQVRLNASASYDPDGLTLTYKWWVNQQELPTTSQQYVTHVECASTKEPGFCVGSTQEFELKVTNPGDLSETAKKSVTIK